MADLAPFRAFRYNPEKIKELGAVIAPPYDVIDPSYQRTLYERHPSNVIRLILGEILPSDDDHNNRYTRAADCLEDWRRDGILVKDQRPSIYLYHQRFQGPDDRVFVRRGFVALLRLEPLESGMVFPHEQTFPKHKIDRLALMKTCHTHFSPIFSLYSDPERELNDILQEPSRQPEMHVTDDHGVEHEIWSIQDPQRIASLIAAMKPRPVFIADGHHRYETCLQYRGEKISQQGPLDDSNPSNWIMMYFTPMEDSGLVIFPTHRLVSGISGFQPTEFLQRLSRDFTIQETPVEEGQEEAAIQECIRLLHTKGETQAALGLVLAGGRTFRVLIPKDPAGLSQRLSRVPEYVRNLSVTVLHEIIFREFLEIDIADPNQQHLTFLHDAKETIKRALRGEVQMAFVMNPTRIEELRAVAGARSKMPQKATYFYPKLLSGAVMNVMQDEEQIGK